METWQTDNNKAMTILRTSSHRQKDNSSHSIQEEEVHSYCKENNLELVHTAKIVESAKDSDDRKQYKAAISYALKKKIRHILFYMNDREARNLTDSERNEKLVKRGLVVIHYVRDKKIIHKESSESDFMLRDFQAIQNKSFSRNLSVKVNDAMRKKAREGWFPGNHPPLGYAHLKNRDENGKELKRGTTIVPNPDEKRQRWVQREFELRALGWSYEKIRRQIIEEGFVRADRQSGYYIGGIEQRLKNPFYRGSFIWQGMIYEGKHKLIIPLKTLKAVDDTFGNRQPYRRVTQAKGSFTGGWLKCAECGCST